MPRDYYEVLGVDRSSSATEIKKTFRALARELHPDVNTTDPDAEERFKEAAEAYEVLSDPERRRLYDAFGHDGLRTGGWSPRSAGAGGFEDIFEAFFGRGDPLFGELFGFGRGGPASGGDIGVEVEIALADVLTGTTREVSFEAVTACEHCRGNGAEPGTPIRTCEDCGGAGQVRRVTRTALGQLVSAGACPTCGGDGRIAEQPCEQCSGGGRVSGTRTWDVDVPAGIESGQRIRIAGAGHSGDAGGGPGDLYVRVTVAEDERFRREGADLVSVADVLATGAMLGSRVTVPTLDGDQEVEVPPGTQPGDHVALRGLGLPQLNGGRRGDQHVFFNVVVPGALSDGQRDLAERLDGSVGPENLRGRQGEGLFARVRRALR
jgi:molecular chaperone DnaJ